jgi:hypothetical protein
MNAVYTVIGISLQAKILPIFLDLKYVIDTDIIDRRKRKAKLSPRLPKGE